MADSRIMELRNAISSYRPGSTIRTARQRPQHPPARLRIGLFGPTGVGKSAFINSALYATGETWDNLAPEGFTEDPHASKTRALNSYDISDFVSLVDNRGMRRLGGNFMIELGNQVAGVYGEGHKVDWDSGFYKRLVSGLKRTFISSKDCEIHTCVLVVSAERLGIRPADIRELVETIRYMTGEPPIIIITNCCSPMVVRSDVAAFRVGLQDMGIDYLFELENYTLQSHDYDRKKHVDALEALRQCLVVGDRVMKNKEESSKCTIL
ncbi:uncharacterized protein [Diadema antillarum]|uniref:uncharacterized protein n=1 Tax=Diadema antillarum TaxID=105358 RepID=UPI003A8BB8B0